jgi:hypothetical protein
MNIDSKTFFVSMDPLEPDKIVLAKPIHRDYLNGSFDDIVKEMTNPDKTEFFQGYNPDQRRISEMVSGWYRESKANGNSVKLNIKAKSKTGEMVQVGLEDRIANFADQILQENEITGSTGAKEKYYLMDLSIAKNTVGGYL